MLCLSGFELYSRWEPLKCNNGLTKTSGGFRGGARGARPSPPIFLDQTETHERARMGSELIAHGAEGRMDY